MASPRTSQRKQASLSIASVDKPSSRSPTTISTTIAPIIEKRTAFVGSSSSSSSSSTSLSKKKKCHRSKLLHTLGFETVPADEAANISTQREPSRGSLLGQVRTTSEPLKYDADFDRSFQEQQARAAQREADTKNRGMLGALGSLFIYQQPAADQSTDDDQRQSSEPPAEQEDTDSGKPSLVASSADNSITTSGGNDCNSTDDSSISTTSTRRRRGLTFNDTVTVVPIPKRQEYSKRVRDRLWVNAQDLQVQAQRNALEFASEGWDWQNVFEDDSMYIDAVTGEKVHPVHCEIEEE